MIRTIATFASLAALALALLIGFQPLGAVAQRGVAQPPPEPAAWEYACVSNYTQILRYVTSDNQCRSYETLLDVSEDQPFTLCASRYTGLLRLPRVGRNCQRHENPIVVDGSAEISACVNPYTGAMRLASDATQCQAGETPVGGGGPISGTLVVNSASLNGWTPYLDSPDGSVEFRVGPESPPLGAGSVCFNTGTNGDLSAQMRNEDWHQTRLDELTALSYSTYQNQWNGQQLPYLVLYLDLNGDGEYDPTLTDDDRIYFEPAYQTPTSGNPSLPDQGNELLATWQTWDALAGGWWSVSGRANANPGAGPNGVKSIDDYLAVYPDATIINDNTTELGGVRITVGYGSQATVFDGCVDQFVISSTNQGPVTYNFEPDIV